jgi:hypothetical protein
MKHSKACVALAALCLAAAATPALSQGVVPRDTIMARVQSYIRALASDSMAGRRPPTTGNTMAAALVARTFERLELAPLKRGGRTFERYYVPFGYLYGVDIGKGNKASIARGGGRPDLILAPGADFTPLGFSSNGSASGPLAFVGYGISDSASGYDDYAGVDTRGAVVLAMRYSPDGDVPHGRFSSASAWTAKVRAALDHGARGIIFVNRPGDPADLPEMAFIRGFLDAGLPCIFTSDASLAALRDPAGRTLADLRAAIDSTVRPASFVYPGSKASITAAVKRLEAKIPNVVGLLPGNDPKLRDQVIVIGGHFDHLGDGGEGSLYGGDEPKTHYGADDNASGTAGMLALAEEFARRHDNRRTLMFMGFNAEEEGVLGSQSFLRENALPKGLKMIAMINLDMIGRLDSGKLQVQGTGTSPGFESMLDSLNPGLRVKYSREGYGPSDHASFYSKSVPVLAFFTGVHQDYHRPTDTWEKINVAGEADVIAYARDVVRTIDRADTIPLFTKADPPVSARRAAAFKVYVGTMPDYGYEGKGLRITGTSSGSPAEKAGLREGDVIVRMAEYPIGNIYDYMDALGHFEVGQEVKTEIVRDGKPAQVMITMGTR